MKIQPEGFKELIDFLSTCQNHTAKASEIQKALKEQHDFTPGKITGIISRAESQKVISKLARGYYQLKSDTHIDDEDNFANAVINEAISTAINIIQNKAGQNIIKIKPEELQKIKDVIEELKNIINSL